MAFKPYGVHFQLHIQFQLLDLIGNCLIQLAIANRKDCQSKFSNLDSNVKVTRSQESLFFSSYFLGLQDTLTSDPKIIYVFGKHVPISSPTHDIL